MSDGLPSEAIQELLEIAGVADSLTARAALEDALRWAEFISTELQQAQIPIPREVYEKVATATHKLLAAMTELDRRWIGRSRHWLEHPGDAQDAILRVQAAAEQAMKQRNPGRAKREDKLAVVVMAARFLQEHSAVKLSTDPASKFTEFVERFFERATFMTSKAKDLDWQIRQTVKLTRAGKLWD